MHSIQLITSEEINETEESVMLMTMHSAKGLEFPVVFIIGCEEGILPHKMALKERSVDEERRLMYVAMTRAKNNLFISHCRKRGDRHSALIPPSRFLFEIDSSEDEER